MMNKAVVVLALVGLAFAAPQTRKLFHEHVEEFLDIIIEESGHELEHLVEQYQEYEEFWVALEYMRTNSFKELVYEMESLPEFVAMVEYLENDNIDVYFFIDLLNGLIENTNMKSRARHSTSGKDLSSYIRDSIDLFPKEKLSALFDQKMSEDEGFRVAIENLQGEEWDQIFRAFWNSEVFQAEIKTLAQYGIDAGVLLDEIMAIFGQN